MNFDTLQHHRKNLTNQDDEEIKLDQIKTIFNIQKGSNKLQDDNVEDQQNKNNISLQNIEESSDKKDRFINLRSCSSSSSFATEPISNKILEQKISVSQILKQNQKNFSEDQPKFISKNDNLNSKILQVNRQVKESPQNFSYFWGNRGVSLSNNCSSIFLTKNEPVTDGILVDEKKYLKMFAQRILLDKQLFNHLNMRTMLCQLSKKKIIHRNRNSDQLIHYGINNKKNDQKSFINLSQELNLKKTANKRQFKRNFENFNLIVYRLSDSFFESFPFYKRIQHNWNQFTQHIKKIQDSENLLLKRNTYTPNSQFQEKVGRKYQIKENILDLIPNSDGRIFKNSLVPQNKLSATKSVQKGQSDNELKKVFNHNLQEEETPLSKILLPILYDQALSSNQQENYNNVIQECLKTGYFLDELQMEIMEMKIYRPYFMSYSTIIEYQTGKKQIQKDEKLSMADILERHFFGKKQFSRLYFKVNLNDDDFLDNLLAQNYSITNSFCQNNMSSKLINTSAIFKKLILDSNAGLIHEENSNQSSSLNSDFRQKIGIENSQKHSSDSQSLSSAENLSDSQSLNFYLKKGDKKRKDKLIIKRRNSSKVNVQQNLLSISNGTPNSFSIIKRSKSREAGKFLLQKQEIKSKNKILNIKSKDESSKFNNLVLTQTIQMDKSISQDSNSEYSLKLSQKSLQTQAEHLEDNVIYFEFEISQMKLNGEELTLLNIKDVTNLVKNQQKMSDMIYQEALENNFAHEQMTPLNILKANSNFLAKRVFQVHVAFEELMKKVDHQITKENSRKLEENKKKNIMEGIESMKMILTMEQATRGLWYFNQSQIVRMKIKNGHHEKVPLPINDLVQPISHVLQAFELQIQGNQISVYLIKKNTFPDQLIADWKQYQLVLFNMIQNAVKYNSQNGEIIILISCKPVKKKIQEKNNNDQIQMVLGTKIIDTGIGITKERQKLLFIPFLELRSLQGLFKKPENDNIGIGLTNSYIITKQLGGSICIKQSKPGLTIFQFKIPVFSQFDQIISTENQTPEISLLMGNMNKGWKEQTKEYLIEQCQTICLEQVIDNTKNMHKRLEEAFQNSKNCEWSSKSMQDLKLRNMERVKHFQLKRMKNRQNSLKEIEPDSNLIENQAIRSIGTHNHQLNMQPLDQITFNNQPSSNGTNQLRLSFPKDEQSFPIKRAIHRFSGNANSSGFSSKFLNFTSQNLSSFKVSNQQDSSNKFNSNSLNRVENIENNSVDEKTKNEQQNELQLRLIQQKRKRTIKPFSHLNILNSQINSEGAKEISLEDYINDSKKKNPSKKKSAKVKQKQKKESNKLISEPQNNIGIKAKNQSVLEILPILNPPQQAINQPFLLLPRSNEKVLNFDQKSNQSQTLKETPYFIQNQNKVNVFNHQFQKVESSESICKNQIVEQNRFLSKGKIKKNSNRIQSCNLRNSQKLMKSHRQQTFQDLNMRVSESELQIKREQLERIKKQSNNDQIQKVYKLLFNLESSINQSKHQHFQNGIVEINQFDQQKESDHLVQNQEFDQSFEEDNEIHIKQHISQLKLMNLLEVNNPVGFDELGPNLAKYFAFKLASGEANKQILTLLAKIDEVKSNKQNQVSKSSVSLKSVSSSKSSPIKRSGQQNIFKRQPKNLNKSRSDRSSSIKIKNRVLYQNSTIKVQEVQNQDYVSIDCGLNQSFPSSNEQVELEFYQKKKLILQPLNEVPSLFSNIDIEQRLNYTINSLINHFQSNQSLKQNDNFKLILSMTLQQLKQLSSSKIINNCKSCGMNQQDSDGLMIRKLHEELQNLSQESDKIQKSNSQLSAHSQSNQNNDDPVIDTSKSSNSVQFMLQNPICHSLSNTPFTINPNKLFFDQQAVKYNFSQKNDQKKEVIKSFSSQGSNYQNIQEDKMKRESSKLDAIKEEHGVGGLSESLQDEELVSANSSFKLIKMPSYAINAPSEYSYNF